MNIQLLDGKALLRAIAPVVRGYKGVRQGQIIEQFGTMLPNVLAIAEATTPLRVAHFLTQTGHESDGFSTMEEYSSGAAYEGRVQTLGNTEPGDGKLFKGRGLIQCTGRRNYAAFGRWMADRQPDAPLFVTQPDRLSTFPWGAYAAAWYWLVHDLNKFADRDDLIGATREINGGTNGLADRRAYLSRAKKAVAKMVGDTLLADIEWPTLRRGSEGDDVEILQRALNRASSPTLTIGVDGDFGAATELVVKHFQTTRGLKADGIVARQTWAALERYIKEN